MKCPYCGCDEQRVLDSRPAREDEAIRRRRECTRCNRRFTTFEEPEKPRLFVVKKNGDREEFSREKLVVGLQTACRKRPVSQERIRDAVERVERELFDLCEPEVASSEIGERVMQTLLEIDEVAYVRFASVYRAFQSPREFREIVDQVRRIQKKQKQILGATERN